MIKYVKRVLAKCRKADPDDDDGWEEVEGGKKYHKEKVEGYEAVDTKGERGVWVYGDEEWCTETTC